MDERDRQIIEILLKNARTPFTEIARHIGVSEALIRKRVENLERKGVIKKYTIEVDPAKMGYNTVTILGIDVEPQYLLSVAKELSILSETRYVATSTGDHMIMAEIWTRDGNELANLMADKIGKIKGIKKLCPAIILERVK